MLKQHALLLINLGTPTEPTHKAIKHYLAEFLRDRHVVDLNPFIWLPILHSIVIPKRLGHITQHYQSIWLNNQSPLLHYSEQLCKKIQNANPNWQCELAMTYGEPVLTSALDRLKTFNTINIVFLYPQYSTTTTLAALNKIRKITQKWSVQPKLNYLRDYADNPAYIHALSEQILATLKTKNKPDVVLLSYHGIPINYIQKRNDDYAKRCELTTQLLRQKINEHDPEIELIMAYQSRFGKGKWTSPNTSDILVELARQGKKSVYVMCPGFSADCIETLHEINIENQKLFRQSGGEYFTYIPCLNDSDLHINLLQTLVMKNLLA